MCGTWPRLRRPPLPLPPPPPLPQVAVVIRGRRRTPSSPEPGINNRFLNSNTLRDFSFFHLLDLPVPVLVYDDSVLGLLHLAALPNAPAEIGGRIVKIKDVKKENAHGTF